jgi:PAS domain S-box-containing protein
MSAAVSRCSRDLRFLWVSNAFGSWLGCAVDDIIDRPIAEVIGPEAFETIRPYIERVLKGERVEYEIQVPYRRIGPRWIHAVYVPTHNGAETNGWVAVIRDIEAQRRRENALRESEHVARRLAAIVESSDDAIVGKDLNGTVTSWNCGAERIFGYAASEIVGKSIRLIIPADRQSEEDHVLERIRRGDRLEHFETVRQRKDGTLVPISLTLSPIRDADGRVVGASKIARDISEQQQHTQRTAFLADVGTTLATSLDYESTLKAVANAAVPAVADWCAVDIVRDERVERLAVAHVDPRKVELATAIRDRYGDPDSPYSVETVVRTGRPVFIGAITDEMVLAAARGDEERIALVRSLGLRSYMCVPLIVAHGHTLGALTLATAESGRVYTERDLMFAENIASRAALAVDNARAYDEAQRANRLKDEFLATLSHELRTPLNAILGYVRIVQSGLVAGDKQAKAIDTVARNAASLTQIVEDVLDVSRIVSGKLRLDVQPVDLGLTVEQAIESIEPAATAQGVQVTTIVDPRADAVSGDPERLQQVIWNVVSNAVKFTPRGGHVQVRVERVESRVQVVVSDTGVGIAPEFLPHIFERFRQADAGTTRKHGGLGLGLAIARHVVELHGGTIDVASAGLGTGATFRISLPVRIMRGETSRVRVPHREPPARRPHGMPNLHGVRILAVDDDSDALTLLREVLEAAGAEVTTVDSAMTALEQVEKVRPDVLIADVGMPQMDGFELISRLRHAKAQSIRDLPAAALTAYARSEDRAKALRTGFQMHLAKPIDPGELMAAVAALAKRNRPQ